MLQPPAMSAAVSRSNAASARSTRCQSVYRLRRSTRLSSSTRTSHPSAGNDVMRKLRVWPARVYSLENMMNPVVKKDYRNSTSAPICGL